MGRVERVSNGRSEEGERGGWDGEGRGRTRVDSGAKLNRWKAW